MVEPISAAGDNHLVVPPAGLIARPTAAHGAGLGTRYRFAAVHGRKIFYREAGDPDAPTIVLLHGFPSSSHMFRELIPLLADRFHVIAPDYLGFGQSEAPSSTEFTYNFENLTALVSGLIDHLHLQSYILYMQGYGGPIGFRLFDARPNRIMGLVVQNANAYLEGLGDIPKIALLPLWEQRNADTEAAARGYLKGETTKYKYIFGARDPEAISPDYWLHDQALLDRPGTDAYQLDLLEDYKTNVTLYNRWHEGFRNFQPKTLILWGAGDPFSTPAGAAAFKNDLPMAKLVWLEGGHFALHENVQLVANEIKLNFAGE